MLGSLFPPQFSMASNEWKYLNMAIQQSILRRTQTLTMISSTSANDERIFPKLKLTKFDNEGMKFKLNHQLFRLNME
jgi:hypothetical protein